MAPKKETTVADVDWSDKSDEGIGPYVKALSTYYLEQQPTNSTPRKMRPLLDFLFVLHRKNQLIFKTEGLGAAHQQFEKDWSAYDARLAGYRVALDDAYAKGPDLPSQPFARDVVGPLIMGWFPDGGSRRVPDAAVAVIQARQIGVAVKALDDAWSQLKDDLSKGVGTSAKTIGLVAFVAALAGIWLARD